MARLRSLDTANSTDQWLNPGAIQTVPNLPTFNGQISEPGGIIGGQQAPPSVPVAGVNNNPSGSGGQTQTPPPPTSGNYYDLFNYYTSLPGETGAQAVAQAAKQATTGTPVSALSNLLQYPQNATGPAQQSPAGTVSYNGDPYAYFENLTKGMSPTMANLATLGPQLKQAGINLIPHNGGVGDKLQLPNGQIVDVLQGSDGPNPQWQWLVDSGQAGSGGQANLGGSASPPIDFSSILKQALSSNIIPQNGPGSQVPIDTTKLNDALMGLINNGGNFNQNIVNQRAEAARTQLGIEQRQQEQNDQAALAARGLTNSGPEITAENRLNQTVGNQYQAALENIIGNESQNADQRMLSALQMAGNLAGGNVQDLINQYATQANAGLNLGNLINNNTLGLGSLALGNVNSANNYNLGVAQVGAQADQAQAQQYQSLINELIMLMQSQGNLTNVSAGGFV